MLPQWHVKDPGHSAKSAGGRLHLNTHTPLTHGSRSGPTMPLFRQSVGIYQETSSHATCQGTFGHNCLSSLSHCGLIMEYRVDMCARANLHFQLKENCRRGMNGRTFPKILENKEKATITIERYYYFPLSVDFTQAIGLVLLQIIEHYHAFENGSV